MKLINSLTELDHLLLEECKKYVDEMGDKVKELIESFIGEYYDEYKPKVYKRTYKFLNSVTRTKPIRTANGYEVIVYMETQNKYKDGFMVGWVAEMADEGLHGGVPVGKSHFWNDAMKETEKLLSSYGAYLQGKGIKVLSKNKAGD